MTFKELLDAIPKTAAAVGAVIAALSATLIKQELIPENLAILGVSASLLVVLAVIFGTVKQEALERRAATLAAVATLCLVVLIVVQLTWVVTADPYGPDNGAHKFLIGSSLTDDGQQMRTAVGGLRGGAFVSAIGHQEIPVAYGASFAVLAGAYTVAYFGFLVGVILALIGLIGKDSKSPDPAPVPTPPTPPTPPAPPPTP